MLFIILLLSYVNLRKFIYMYFMQCLALLYICVINDVFISYCKTSLSFGDIISSRVPQFALVYERKSSDFHTTGLNF